MKHSKILNVNVKIRKFKNATQPIIHFTWSNQEQTTDKHLITPNKGQESSFRT